MAATSESSSPCPLSVGEIRGHDRPCRGFLDLLESAPGAGPTFLPFRRMGIMAPPRDGAGGFWHGAVMKSGVPRMGPRGFWPGYRERRGRRKQRFARPIHRVSDEGRAARRPVGVAPRPPSSGFGPQTFDLIPPRPASSTTAGLLAGQTKPYEIVFERAAERCDIELPISEGW